MQNTRPICFLPFVLCFAFCALIASVPYAQEENDSSIELPPVKIEVVDTTRLDIPRERFRSYTKPDPGLYAPLSSKERPWYVPSTSIPEKIRETQVEEESNSLFSLTAQFGNPQALAYQALLMKGFGNSEVLLNAGRTTLWSDRTAQLAGDPSSGLGDSTIDRIKASAAHQTGNSDLEADVHYDARQLGFLDRGGEEYPNDRSLMGFLAGWDQVLSENTRSSVDLSLSSLKTTDPLSAGYENGLELGTDLGLRMLWPGSNPLDAGLGVKYFASNIEATETSPAREFSEAILRLGLRDNHIRLWPFVLGISMELMLDARKDSIESADWELDLYPKPCVFLTSQIGGRTTLRFGAERHILWQDLSSVYLDNDYMIYNPELPLEKAWSLSAVLQSRFMPGFTVTVGGFGKEIRDLTVFEETTDGILSWTPASREKARIYGFRSGWELSLLDGRIKQSLEFIHEEHDQEIPYRPNDRGLLDVTCLAPFGLELSLSGEFCGVRYVSADGGDEAETLSSYFLWKPRISRTFGKYATVFLMAEFYVGQDDYQVWKGYELPDQTVDFGLTLKF
jgi:hypothetical protein